MAESDIEHTQRRSSSRTSSSSRHSQIARPVRTRSQKRQSAASSNATTTDLTSFPSLSPDRSVEGFFGKPALNRALTNALLDDHESGDNSSSGEMTGRDRRATLAKLTGGMPRTSGRAALFDDAVPVHDFPGALHLADDAHIERLVASTGAVKLVRQFARDLAQRDAEISALRQRADARERELKRMLREVSVSNQDIERRLYALENAPQKAEKGQDDAKVEQEAGSSSGVHGLMQQAMTDNVGSRQEESLDATSAQATLRAPQRLESDAKSGTSSVESGSGTTRKRQSSLRNWQDYIFGSNTASRKTSRASSIMTDVGEVDEEDTRRQRNPVNAARRKALDEQLFNPLGGQTGSAGEIIGKSLAGISASGDDASIHSRKSSRSVSSWAVKLFAGNPQTNKEENNTESPRGRALSTNRERGKGDSPSLQVNSKGAISAVAALKRINSNASIHGAPGRLTSGPGAMARSNQVGRRHAASSVSHGASSETADHNPTNLGPVEMDAILPMESRPPTLSHMYNNYQPSELLTDRFGFIYDQRRKKRQREASVLKNGSNRISIAETLNSFRTDNSDGDSDDLQRQCAAESSRSPVPSPEDPESGDVAVRRWQDYLRIATGPAELLSHTPSAGPIVSLTTGESQPRGPGVAVDKRGSLSVNPNAQPSASTSAVVADRPEFAGTSTEELAATAATVAVNENEPVKLLLEQLTDLHDSLQRDRTVRWNEFLRKVRAERRKEGEAAAAAAAASDRPLQSVHMPEASLADGEVVGVAGLGNKGKVGRAKWREFRALVLGGIPVALRAKVWSECCGASSMRVPGYYDDLVKGVGGSDPDPSVIAQIDMDINRTLTDNVFFRKGPGVNKLKEVLLAYARRNSEVGYCQGMNLIAASLLLITPAAEDAFWILASMIEIILPEHYYDHGLLASRADQVVLRQYISEVLPKLAAHLEALGVELEALTFQWFLSVFTDCLSAEALYRVWDVVLCLNATSVINPAPTTSSASSSSPRDPNDSSASATKDIVSGNGGGSTFLFQVALALLKLNEQQLLTTCSTPAELYTYINHQMTNHAISIDGLIQASEALRNVVRREDVVERRAVAMREFGGYPPDESK
ncbi:hypothetical protein BDV23DRAFT_39642 [Aspergillus alliaceus]|uniref:Rab-GAP TBC domain-containing protein n=1 Tax=Petromyces alliaceus TaxID=209559 RepID=A0A5N7CIR9_PETAA|nr:hypothetical protein BDV23DRAFT_39642 [Aspergillus alliaceus]